MQFYYKRLIMYFVFTQVYPRPSVVFEDLNKVQKSLYKVMVNNQRHDKQLFHIMLYYSVIKISFIKINHNLILK